MYHPYLPKIKFMTEEFGINEITIGLEWTSTQDYRDPFHSLVSYDVNVEPNDDIIVVMVDTLRANLTVLYNIPYNVSVVAAFCGQMNASDIAELMYGESTLSST